MCICADVVALDQILEEVVVTGGMAVRIHCHETGMLQKARVDATSLAGKVSRHRVDHIVFKPLVGLGRCQVVNRCGTQARIDWATHHDHGQRGFFPA